MKKFDIIYITREDFERGNTKAERFIYTMEAKDKISATLEFWEKYNTPQRFSIMGVEEN